MNTLADFRDAQPTLTTIGRAHIALQEMRAFAQHFADHLRSLRQALDTIPADGEFRPLLSDVHLQLTDALARFAEAECELAETWSSEIPFLFPQPQK